MTNTDTHNDSMRRHCAIFLGMAALLCQIAFAASANAAIIYIKGEQSCNVIGLDPSPDAAQNGVHCAGASGMAFSMSDLLNGDIAFFVGDSSTPSWNVVNDTGETVFDLVLFYSGALASNSDIDLQLSGGDAQGWFDDCSAIVTTTGNCGGKEAEGPLSDALPLQLIWMAGTTGTGIAPGEIFNIGTASFAHAGQDAGCISGTASCSPAPVPVPAPVLLLISALASFGVIGRRRGIID